MLSALHAQHVPATLLLPRDSIQLVRACLQDAKLLDSLFSTVVREPWLEGTGMAQHFCTTSAEEWSDANLTASPTRGTCCAASSG